MEQAAFKRWLDAYVAAWEAYDAAAIGALFARDATYQWHPWDDEADQAAHGRAAIVEAWLADQDAPGSWQAAYEPWAIDGERGVAVGVSRYLTPEGTLDREYHNVFLCRFDAEGRCVEFTELYMQRP